MSRANHPNVLVKGCPFCPKGRWYIRHFNGNEQCTRYATCSCGGQVRANNNQSIFYGDPVDDPLTGQPDPQPVKDTENKQTQQPTTGKPITDDGIDEGTGEWIPF